MSNAHFRTVRSLFVVPLSDAGYRPRATEAPLLTATWGCVDSREWLAPPAAQTGARRCEKNGFRCAHKLELIAAALTHLPARSCIIDGELTACDEYGLPTFHALHFHRGGHTERCAWAFDLLYVDGRNLREHPLSYRKRRLEKLVLKVGDGRLRYSESFTDGAKLLAAAERMGLEGVVSKLWVSAYRLKP